MYLQNKHNLKKETYGKYSMNSLNGPLSTFYTQRKGQHMCGRSLNRVSHIEQITSHTINGRLTTRPLENDHFL